MVFMIRFRKKGRSRGKVLKVKQGYNPNSSSMGSIVFVLPTIMFAITVVAGALLGALAPQLESLFLRGWRRRQEKIVRKKTK
jgi:hypothetical protein